MATAALDIGVLQSSSRYRGIGRYTHDLARGLGAIKQPDGLRVVGFELRSWTGRAALVSDLASAADRLADPDAPMMTHTRWAHRQRLVFARALRSSGADLVHNPHPEATPIGRLGCLRVITCHDLIPYRYPEFYAGWRDGYATGRRWLDRRRYHAADHIIAVSHATASDLISLAQVPASKITVVHNGVDLSKWSPSPEPDDAGIRDRHDLAEQPYLLYVGAAEWRKNPHGMMSALKLARSRPGCGELVLAWAGKLDGSWGRRIARAADELGLDNVVRPLGFVSDRDLAALYRGAVAQLFISRVEGFGYPVIEAMASGCPVVASNCSSTAEIATDAALSVDPEDHEAIAAAIAALVTDEGERSRLREAGLLRARRFSLERMALATREVYRELLD
jgi:glycosyltransferase involved in cell wall biosynthesis